MLVLNGPNLGRLGRREPEIYGTTTHADLAELCAGWGRELGLEVEIRQTNHEGELLDWLNEAADDRDPGRAQPGGVHPLLATRSATPAPSSRRRWSRCTSPTRSSAPRSSATPPSSSRTPSPPSPGRGSTATGRRWRRSPSLVLTDALASLVSSTSRPAARLARGEGAPVTVTTAGSGRQPRRPARGDRACPAHARDGDAHRRRVRDVRRRRAVAAGDVPAGPARPDASGVTSDDGFVIGQITLSGSLNLALIVGPLFGILGAGFYLACGGLAIGPRWFRLLSLSLAARRRRRRRSIVHPDGRGLRDARPAVAGRRFSCWSRRCTSCCCVLFAERALAGPPWPGLASTSALHSGSRCCPGSCCWPPAGPHYHGCGRVPRPESPCWHQPAPALDRPRRARLWCSSSPWLGIVSDIRLLT